MMLSVARQPETQASGAASIGDELRSLVGEDTVTPQATADAIPTLWVAPENIHKVLTRLKTGVDQPYRMLYDLTAIDERMKTYPQDDPASDFTIVYHLLSFDRNEYIRIKTPLKEERATITRCPIFGRRRTGMNVKSGICSGSVLMGIRTWSEFSCPEPGAAIRCARTIQRVRRRWAPFSFLMQSRMPSRKHSVFVPKNGA